VHTTHFWYILQPGGTLSDKIFEGKLAKYSKDEVTDVLISWLQLLVWSVVVNVKWAVF